MAAPLNKMQTSMGMPEMLALLKRDIFLSLNCHALATVQTFDSANLVVTAKMNYSKTYYQANGKGVMVPILKDYPLLVDCPIVILGGGGGSLTFPIAAGDECLIIFNDRDIDNWIAGATSGPVATNRLHSFSDAIALIGFAGPASYDSTRAVLANGPTGVGVSPTKVKIYNATTTLGTILDTLLTAMASATTVANIAAAATTAKTALDGLLE